MREPWQDERPATASHTITMKWSTWSADRSTWMESGGGAVLRDLDALGEEGEEVRIEISSSKECRHGIVVVTGDVGAYKARGHFVADLDDDDRVMVAIDATAPTIDELLVAVDAFEAQLIEEVES